MLIVHVDNECAEAQSPCDEREQVSHGSLLLLHHDLVRAVTFRHAHFESYAALAAFVSNHLPLENDASYHLLLNDCGAVHNGTATTTQHFLLLSKSITSIVAREVPAFAGTDVY